MNSVVSPLSSAGEGSHFHAIVEEVSHLLPAQAPIRRFVHHNTLHHFQDLNFHEAVKKAHHIFGCSPYPSESFFAEQRETGRITESDIEAVLTVDKDGSLPFNDWTRREFRIFRLRHLFATPEPTKIRYMLEEGELLQSLAPGIPDESRTFFPDGAELAKELSALWKLMLGHAVTDSVGEPEARLKEEEKLHSLLIRYCGAYLDQGISYWPIPLRDGFYPTFLRLYSQSGAPLGPEFRGLDARLRKQLKSGWTAEEALSDALKTLEIPPEKAYDALLERGLALRGWAGMISVLEKRPDLAPLASPAVSLLDYFAVYMQLEAHLSRGRTPTKSGWKRTLKPDYPLAFEAFYLSQYAGLKAGDFQGAEAVKAWLREIREFDDLERREVLLEAYERRYRNEILDAMSAHTEAGEAPPVEAPRFQAVFCIDDREESIRRHLEELCPEMETMGYAGFFGVPMAYRGLTDPHTQPLCPPAVTPKHIVREVAVKGSNGGLKAIGGVRQTLRASRNSLVRGGLLSALGGFLAGVPLVGQTLVPGLFHNLSHTLEQSVAGRPKTRLTLERPEGEGPGESGYFEGFTVSEMTEIVTNAFKAMGVSRFAPLFALVGHGSSSLNNPHEAAHDCGATGGGRGGPNARTFAAMANHPKVRESLAGQGWKIPETTWFLGAYHNTCDDTVEYYDLDLLPDSHRAQLGELKQLLLRGCKLDAHERCRRFRNTSLNLSLDQAYSAVQARAVHLAQPRPEYGHSTNSLCIVGRRERTRGLFLDRRAFLVSYNPFTDEDGSILADLLQAVGPVGAGINLEYYFSRVDPSGYGCGTKLPHNVSGLLGIMDGHSSDLRTGLPWQMVETHEPMRLLNIVECDPEKLKRVLDARPAVKQLVERGWIQLVAWSPSSSDFWTYSEGTFQIYRPESKELRTVDTSKEHYQGNREHLPPARVLSALRKAQER